MVINDLLKEGVTLMKGLAYANPILESILVLSHILKEDKVYIYTYGDKEVDKDQAQEFIKLMGKRAKGYPLSYLLGKKEFMGLDFYVEEGVLIPRPETEILIEYIIDKINKEFMGKKISILDIGVGSGAIALSLGKNCPQAKIYGVDLHPKPIEVANINKERFGLDNVDFYQGDLFEPIEELEDGVKFDIIISNPPYIRSGDIEKLQKDVKDFEPRSALDGGEDGLDFYRRISKEARGYLKENGILVYEIGYDQGADVRKILENEGFSHINLLEDFQGHDRIISGLMEKKGV